MDLGLKDKLIVVAAGEPGIAAEVAHACVREGAHVVILSRSSEEVQPFMRAVEDSCTEYTLIEADLQDTEQCMSAIEEIRERFGDLYGLVNNGAVMNGVGLEEGDIESFTQSLNTSLVPCYALAHYALAGLKRTQGTIVNIISRAAPEKTSAHAASNRGQLGLTREWAAELLPHNIRVNAVVPAAAMTPASEIAAAAVFLLSPTRSAHTTGQHVMAGAGKAHPGRARA